MPELAQSLELVAKNGADEFYRGSIAKKIVASMELYGGLISEEDLDSVKAEWMEPLTIKYRDYEVNTVPPNSSGFQILETLKILETLPPEKIKFQDPDFIHYFMETTKLAATDRITHGGDQSIKVTPTEKLLSNSYAKYQSSRISNDKVNLLAGEVFNPDAPQGALTSVDLNAYDGGMTTHFAVADKDLENNILIVAQGHDHPALFHQSLEANQIHWISGSPPHDLENISAKIRYRQMDQSCEITTLSSNRCTVKFDKPQYAITPGQSIVFYKSENCLGGAIIDNRN